MHKSSDGRPIVLQINTYPLDLPYFEASFHHQMRAFYDQVDRVILSVDTLQSQSGRYKGTDKGMRYEQCLADMRSLCSSLQQTYPKLQVRDVDYSPDEIRHVAKMFFGCDTMPLKAWDGGPFYCYFHGLSLVPDAYVLHMDADMLFGGQSQSWIAEAVETLRDDEKLLFVSPLAGPPHPDGLRGGHLGAPFVTEQAFGNKAYRFADVSTRVFLMDMFRFRQDVAPIGLKAPEFSERLRALLLGNPPDVISAELVLSAAMAARGLGNLHLFGSDGGLYSLHPFFHTEAYCKALPDLIRRIETDDIPEAQRGDYELNASMFDWGDALRKHRKIARVSRRLYDAGSYWRSRIHG